MAGSIFSGRSSSPGGGLQGSMQGPGPQSYIGEQLSAFDPYQDLKDFYAWKQDQDLRMANKQDFQQNALSAAAPSPGAESQQAMPLRDMMQTKLVLDQMTPFNTAGGTNTQFRNMPAASAMTGLNLPRSGWETYAMLAGAAPPADPSQQARANAMQQSSALLGRQKPANASLF